MESASQTSEMDALKAKLRATWISGDFGQIARFYVDEAADFVNRLGLKPGSRCSTSPAAPETCRCRPRVSVRT